MALNVNIEEVRYLVRDSKFHYEVEWEVANFVKVQIVNILSFAGHILSPIFFVDVFTMI